VYHIELRQFPHNLNHYNLSGDQLRVIVEPWVREKVFEVEERKWNPQTAKLIILQGPELPLDQLTMGRGWAAAQREGVDVTDQVLAQAAAAAAAEAQAGAPPAPAAAGSSPQLTLEALGAQAAALLGSDPGRLLAEWRSAAARAPGLSPSESLALAEHALRTSAGGAG
jgi:hypothetical protein